VRSDRQSAGKHVGLEVRHERRASYGKRMSALAAYRTHARAQHTCVVAPHVTHETIRFTGVTRPPDLVFVDATNAFALNVARSQVATEQHIGDGT
jgi:hypothetical protein